MACLRRITSCIRHKEAAAVTGYSLGLVTYGTGIDNLFRTQVYLRHIAVVGIRGAVEVFAIGSQLAVVGNILCGSYGGSVGTDVLDDVRPVDRDGDERVVHHQQVVASIAQALLWILLSEPFVGKHTMVDERDGGVVHSPQSLAEHEQAIVGSRGMTVSHLVVHFHATARKHHRQYDGDGIEAYDVFTNVHI